MKHIYIIISSLLTALILSCSESSVDAEATMITLSELKTSPGFEWFMPEYNAYTPDETIAGQIEQSYNQAENKFFVFANPSCACQGTQKLFPSIVKSLTEAGIDEPNFELYSIPTSSTDHPYERWFKLNTIPAAFTMKINGTDTSFYSIVDTMNAALDINPDTTDKIEHFILYSLQ